VEKNPARPPLSEFTQAASARRDAGRTILAREVRSPLGLGRQSLAALFFPPIKNPGCGTGATMQGERR